MILCTCTKKCGSSPSRKNSLEQRPTILTRKPSIQRIISLSFKGIWKFLIMSIWIIQRTEMYTWSSKAFFKIGDSIVQTDRPHKVTYCYWCTYKNFFEGLCSTLAKTSGKMFLGLWWASQNFAISSTPLTSSSLPLWARLSMRWLNWNMTLCKNSSN